MKESTLLWIIGGLALVAWLSYRKSQETIKSAVEPEPELGTFRPPEEFDPLDLTNIKLPVIGAGTSPQFQGY